MFFKPSRHIEVLFHGGIWLPQFSNEFSFNERVVDVVQLMFRTFPNGFWAQTKHLFNRTLTKMFWVCFRGNHEIGRWQVNSYISFLAIKSFFKSWNLTWLYDILFRQTMHLQCLVLCLRLEAASWKLWMLDAGCWKLGAGGWKLEAGSCMLKAGCWKLEAGNNRTLTPSISASLLPSNFTTSEYQLKHTQRHTKPHTEPYSKPHRSHTHTIHRHTQTHVNTQRHTDTKT